LKGNSHSCIPTLR